MYRKHERGPQIPGVVFVVFLAGCLVSSFARNAGTAASDEYEKKIEEKHIALDSIKSELIKGREKLKQLQQEEGSYTSQLEQLEKNIGISKSYMERLDIKIDSTSHTIDSLEALLCRETKKLKERQEEMKSRLRHIYKSGQLTLPQALLSSRDVSDMLHRARYFEVLNHYDRKLLGQIDSARLHIQAQKSSIEKERRQLSLLKLEKEKEYRELVEEQGSRRKLLEDVRSQKLIYAGMIKELETAQKELKNIVAMLENKRKKARTAKEQGMLISFEKRKGALPWPVEGAIVTGFGKVVHSVYKTVVMNTGIDIRAGKGEKVFCIASGKVAYVGSMRGFGTFVIVDHGGYYTTYARLDEVMVEKDEEVKSGSFLGAVGGDSGLLGGSKLHFEIRRSTEALDPVEWLEEKKK